MPRVAAGRELAEPRRTLPSASQRLPYGLRRDSEWSQQREKMGPLSRRCRLFDLDPDLLPLFQYNCKQFASPQECLASPEFLDHIRKVRGVGATRRWVRDCQESMGAHGKAALSPRRGGSGAEAASQELTHRKDWALRSTALGSSPAGTECSLCCLRNPVTSIFKPAFITSIFKAAERLLAWPCSL